MLYTAYHDRAKTWRWARACAGVRPSPVPPVDAAALAQVQRILAQNPDAIAEQLVPKFGGVEKAKTLMLAAKIPSVFHEVSLDVSAPATVHMGAKNGANTAMEHNYTTEELAYMKALWGRAIAPKRKSVRCSSTTHLLVSFHLGLRDMIDATG
jgi:ABC-type sugar transport system substrate-binding protein